MRNNSVFKTDDAGAIPRLTSDAICDMEKYMSRIWKSLWTVAVSTILLTGTGAGFVAAQEDAPAADQNAAEQQEKTGDDEIEFDESEPAEDSADGDALEQAVEQDLGAAAQSNSPEELLNLATEIKLTAKTLLDLTKVVSLCNKAEKLGLDEDNLEFARKLRISAQLDRGLAIAQLFLDPAVNVAQLPPGWEALRDNAIGDLTVATKENPDIAAAQLGLGRLYMLSDKNDEAKAAFEAAINGEDESGEDQIKPLAYMYRAELQSDAKASVADMEKALEICPEEEPRFHSLYAEYLARVGRDEDALAAVDKGLALPNLSAPFDVELAKQKARILVRLHRKDEAREVYEKASQNDGDDVSAQIDKGQFYAMLGDYDASIALFTKLAEKFDGPGIYLLRGMVYADKKDFDAAIADANQALRRDGSMLAAIRLKGLAFVQLEKYDEAVRAFELLKRKSKTAEEKLEATTQIAYVISKQGRYRRASEILKKELEKDPKNASDLRSLADMELLFGHWGEAKRLYAELLEIDPEDTGVLNNYSWLLGTCPDEQYRDAALALEYGKKAAEGTYYKLPHILSTLAAAYAENGDFESARSWSQKGVDLATADNDDNLEDLKKELESYKENKPWRETSEVLAEVDEDESAEKPADEEPKPEEKDAAPEENADSPEA